MSAAQKTDPFLLLVITMWVFAASLFLCNAVGFVPYYIDGSTPTVSDTTKREYQTIEDAEAITKKRNETTPVPNTEPDDFFIKPIGGDLPSVVAAAPDVPFLPESLRIPALNRELSVVNPVKRDVATLDRELLDAVVRYPDSGLLNEDGNIFIFGHSSHLRTVHNQLFKAFNGIETLPKGSLLELLANGRVFVYQVTNVKKVSADDALVDLDVASGQRILTLSTCNSFGAKTDRFVVTAEFSVSYVQ
jgi:LPXTG-site transpeptidase (sortase) family protein